MQDTYAQRLVQAVEQLNTRLANLDKRLAEIVAALQRLEQPGSVDRR